MASPKKQPAKKAPAKKETWPGGRSPDFQADSTIRGMPDTFLQCRDFGHSWRPFAASRFGQNSYEEQLKCARCKAIRLRYIGADGRMLRNRYEYAEGYVVVGMGRLQSQERDLIRLESVLRILPDDAVEE